MRLPLTIKIGMLLYLLALSPFTFGSHSGNGDVSTSSETPVAPAPQSTPPNDSQQQQQANRTRIQAALSNSASGLDALMADTNFEGILADDTKLKEALGENSEVNSLISQLRAAQAERTLRNGGEDLATAIAGMSKKNPDSTQEAFNEQMTKLNDIYGSTAQAIARRLGDPGGLQLVARLGRLGQISPDKAASEVASLIASMTKDNRASLSELLKTENTPVANQFRYAILNANAMNANERLVAQAIQTDQGFKSAFDSTWPTYQKRNQLFNAILNTAFSSNGEINYEAVNQLRKDYKDRLNTEWALTTGDNRVMYLAGLKPNSYGSIDASSGWSYTDFGTNTEYFANSIGQMASIFETRPQAQATASSDKWIADQGNFSSLSEKVGQLNRTPTAQSLIATYLTNRVELPSLAPQPAPATTVPATAPPAVPLKHKCTSSTCNH